MPVKVQCPNPDCMASFNVAPGEEERFRHCPNCGAELSEIWPEPGEFPETSPDRSAPSWPVWLVQGATFAGRYKIIRVLGRGGMGTVYLAHDAELDRDVALKVPLLDSGPDSRGRFRREAKAAARLHHPNICPIFDVGEKDGQPYLTMAFIDGMTLAEHLKGRAGPFDPAEAAVLVRTLALAVHEAHASGTIHRDLKPSNVMLARDGRPVVLDFGLARREDPDDSLKTKTGQMMGTPAYMPLEQHRGDSRAIGPASDVYSLGVVLFQLLTGRPPFEGNAGLVLEKLLTSGPPSPSALRPGLDRALESICLKAMSRGIDDRYSTMYAFAEALADYLSKVDRPPAATPTVRPALDKAVITSAPIAATMASPDLVVTNSIGMTLRLIPAGEFLMGSPDWEPEAQGAEKPRHKVRITRPYCLGVYPVTQEEYEAVMGQKPSYFRDRPRHPVEQVSWFDAVEFCNRLSERERLRPFYRVEGEVVIALGGDGYRLPTEAEWEYACRAGTTTLYSFGDRVVKLGEHAWYGEDSSGTTAPVGEKKPNAFGLHDMHGNVWEWCWDWFGPEYYRASPPADPSGPSEASRRVIRGGSWLCGTRSVRSADRSRCTPGDRCSDQGFRVAQVQSGR